MSVQRRERNGKVRWVARYRDPGGKERSKTFDRQADAKEWVADREKEVRRGSWVDTDNAPTLRALAEGWRDMARRSGTRKDRQWLIDNLGDMADYKVTDIRPSHLAEWLKCMRYGRPWAGGARISEKNIANRAGQLRGLLQRAADDDLIVKSPGHALKRAAEIDSVVDERDVPTDTEIRAIIDVATNGGSYEELRNGVLVTVKVEPRPWLADAVVTACETGLRSGEVSGILARNVDTERCIISVRQQCGKRVGELEPLKSTHSRRDVPVTRSLIGRFDLSEPDGPALRGGGGRGMTSRLISATMPKLQKAAGVRESISFHSFRHYYASRLLAEGVPLATVSALLGHANIGTTSVVYAHFLPDQLDGARRAVRAIAGRVRDDTPQLRAI